ncbi:unnamed protein product (macronuclear) [Paramecium tetraurelia]|uniref:SKP1 component dimerisation domain-containing protein n=1 Tax=Paramecium tetraurelia TaxID=5888 RepID=A0BNV7_PARTE|nr:uncharacterized protein GSPATT00030863001 [Paramecium tetraurelia]CAK60224.1 unnamed protein product [Paramecium tetraurelia]|eukprot:XP_001427622.1 hypothetical protein (macronuclear) [Paramecium tetraurelia strain d4-2]
MDSKIKITTLANENLYVDKSIILESPILKEAYDKSENGEIIIDFPFDILEIVFAFYENHKHEKEIEIKAPLNKQSNFQNFIDKKDYQMLEKLCLNKQQQLIQTCNHLQYNQLMKITCASLANKLQYMDTGAIRQMFNIQQDQSKEQLERISMENKWLKE